jgi:raffinose/stachyose/melibiose transport system substrate-binding protein
MKVSGMKALQWGMVLALLMGLLSACGGGSKNNGGSSSGTQNESAAGGSTSSSSSSSGGSAKPAKITFTTLSTSESEQQAFEEIFANFKQATGHTVELEILPGGNEYENIIKTRFATNDPPEIFYFFTGPNEYINLDAEENLVEMTNEAFVQTLTPAVRDFYTLDGKIYGIPWGSYNALGVIYNKKVFAENGLELPKNYGELLQIAETLKGKGITPFFEAVNTVWPTQIFFLAGFQSFVLPVIGEDGVQKIINNELRVTDIPEVAELFQRYYDLKTAGYLNEDLLSGTYELQQETLSNGKSAMAFQADWILPIIQERFGNAEDMGFFPVPGENDAGIVSLYPPKQIFVSKEAENLDAIMELVRFMTSPESLAVWHKYNAGVPVYNGVESEMYPAQEDIYNYIQSGQGVVQIQLRTKATFVPELDKITQEFIIEGNVDKTVKRIDENYRQDGKNKKLPGFE